jgi:hypothetical protein
MLALLYDVHGNLPALDAVLADARARGATRWLVGGDAAPFGGWPVEVLERLDALDAVWIRGNTERWLADRSDLPQDAPMHAAVLACRAALGDARADALAALPESASLPGGGRAWHGSPVSDMRSFLPRPADADADAELLAGAEEPLLAFGHTHLQFRREAPRPGGAGTIELLNPGSVGMPLDGDRRAAYALLGDSGAADLRRVGYDWAAARDRVRAVADGAPWGALVGARIEQARFDVG